MLLLLLACGDKDGGFVGSDGGPREDPDTAVDYRESRVLVGCTADRLGDLSRKGVRGGGLDGPIVGLCDGYLLQTDGAGGRLVVVDTVQGYDADWALDLSPSALSLAPEGRAAVAIGDAEWLVTLDLEESVTAGVALDHQPELVVAGPEGMAFTKDQDGGMRAVSAEGTTLSQVSEVGGSWSGIGAMLWDPVGEQLFAASSGDEGQLFRFSWEGLLREDLAADADPALDLALTLDGAQLLVAGEELLAMDPADFSELGRFEGSSTSVAISPDGQWVGSTDGQAELRLHRLSDRGLEDSWTLESEDCPGLRIERVRFSAGGGALFAQLACSDGSSGLGWRRLD